MSEAIGCCTDDAKAKFFPEGYRYFISANDNVELHSPIAVLTGKCNGMLTYFFSDTLSSCIGVNHIAAVRNVTSQARMVWFDNIGSHYLSLLFGHECDYVFSEPMLF